MVQQWFFKLSDGFALSLACVLLGALSQANAQYEYDDSLHLHGPESSESERWEMNPHHLSFLTAWTFTESGEDAFTLGLDYEYRVNSFLGVGSVLEHAYGPLDATTILAVADLHVWKGLAVQTGPGAVIEEHHEFFCYRIGVLYEFELPYNLSFLPQLHYDYIDGADNEWIAAFAFGWSF